MADARAGRPVKLRLDSPVALDAAEIYNVALPPIPRPSRKTRPRSDNNDNRAGVLPLGGHELVNLSRSLPLHPTRAAWLSGVPLVIATDGSARDSSSGWGFCVARQSLNYLIVFCGPTELNALAPSYVSATCHTNNVGELTAILFALRWVALRTRNETVVIQY